MYWYLLSLNQYNSELANKYDNDLFIADVHNVCSSQNILAFSDFLNELIISFIIRNSSIISSTESGHRYLLFTFFEIINNLF